MRSTRAQKRAGRGQRSEQPRLTFSGRQHTRRADAREKRGEARMKRAARRGAKSCRRRRARGAMVLRSRVVCREAAVAA